MVFRIPPELKEAISQRAAAADITQTSVVLDAVSHATQNGLISTPTTQSNSLFSHTPRKTVRSGTVPFEIRVPDQDAITLDTLVTETGAASRTDLLVRSLTAYLQHPHT